MNTLKTDQGLEFCNEKLTQVCAELGILHETTKGHAHRENGAAERFIETLRLMLRKRGADLVDWVAHLPYALFRYNRTPHRATGYSPFMMLHGYEPRFPTSEPYLDQQPHYIDSEDYISNFLVHLAIMRREARTTMETYRHIAKEFYDTNTKAQPTRLHVGDRVMAFMPLERSHSGKLAPTWFGPYVITEISENSAAVQPQLSGEQPLRLQLEFLRHVPDHIPDRAFHFGRTRRRTQATQVRRSDRMKTTLQPCPKVLGLTGHEATRGDDGADGTAPSPVALNAPIPLTNSQKTSRRRKTRRHVARQHHQKAAGATALPTPR